MLNDVQNFHRKLIALVTHCLSSWWCCDNIRHFNNRHQHYFHRRCNCSWHGYITRGVASCGIRLLNDDNCFDADFEKLQKQILFPVHQSSNEPNKNLTIDKRIKFSFQRKLVPNLFFYFDDNEFSSRALVSLKLENFWATSKNFEDLFSRCRIIRS